MSKIPIRSDTDRDKHVSQAQEDEFRGLQPFAGFRSRSRVSALLELPRAWHPVVTAQGGSVPSGGKEAKPSWAKFHAAHLPVPNLPI